MIDEIFLFDTYALIEILNKNKNYEKYTNATAIINNFIFAEFCYKLILNNVKDTEKHLNELMPAISHVDTETIKEAMAFRVKNKDKKMSMTDCISYFMAKKLGIKFLTGDRQFKGMENVEFVK